MFVEGELIERGLMLLSPARHATAQEVASTSCPRHICLLSGSRKAGVKKMANSVAIEAREPQHEVCASTLPKSRMKSTLPRTLPLLPLYLLLLFDGYSSNSYLVAQWIKSLHV